jgi:glutamine amidotransferase-like uncharacterized protein
MKPTIALFLHQPKCSVQSGNGIIKALGEHYNFKIFTKHELEDDFFDNVDIVAFPGGLGDSDSFDSLLKNNRNRIYDFIRNGGRYLGICMGAYWAGREYFNILHNVDVEQYITRPNTDTRRPHAKNLKVEWLGEEKDMFFYDGCAFGPGYYDTIAKYMNGDAMAIIQGRVGLIGCHPESEPHWYESYSWMKNKYHNGEQHQLLLDFVNRLMEA